MTVSMLARIAGHLKLGCLSILIRRVASVIPSVCYLIGQGVLRGFLSHGNVDGQKTGRRVRFPSEARGEHKYLSQLLQSLG